MSAHLRRGTSRPPLGALLALVATSLLALALWGAALWQVGSTALGAMRTPAVDASVVACSNGPVGPGCSVRFRAADGAEHVRVIDRPGLVGAAPGEVVPIRIAADDTIGVAGWRAWVDGLLLLGLATFMTTAAARWFGRVLRAGDPVTVYDLEDDADGRDLRHRDVG